MENLDRDLCGTRNPRERERERERESERASEIERERERMERREGCSRDACAVAGGSADQIEVESVLNKSLLPLC